MVWDTISTFTPQLNQLQQKCETLSSYVPLDPDQVHSAYWTRVGEKLLAIAKKLKSYHNIYVGQNFPTARKKQWTRQHHRCGIKTYE